MSPTEVRKNRLQLEWGCTPHKAWAASCSLPILYSNLAAHTFDISGLDRHICVVSDKMDVQSALKVLEDLPAQAEQVKQLSLDIQQRILALAKNLPSLVLTPEQIAFMQIIEVI